MKRNYTEHKLINMFVLLISMVIGIGIGLMFNESDPDYWNRLKDVVSIAFGAFAVVLAHSGLKTWKTQHVFLESYKSITSLFDSVFEVKRKAEALQTVSAAFYVWSDNGPVKDWDGTIRRLPDAVKELDTEITNFSKTYEYRKNQLTSESKCELNRLKSNMIRDVAYWSRSAKEAGRLLSENDYKENSAYSSCAFYTSELKNNAIKSTRECLDYLESLKNELLNQ